MYYNKRFVGSRIFRELKSKGAEGSATGFYSYLKKIRQEVAGGGTYVCTHLSCTVSLFLTGCFIMGSIFSRMVKFLTW